MMYFVSCLIFQLAMVLKYCLTNNSGEISVSESAVKALADVFLPDIVAFFETEEGREEFTKWKAEKDRHLKTADNNECAFCRSSEYE